MTLSDSEYLKEECLAKNHRVGGFLHTSIVKNHEYCCNCGEKVNAEELLNANLD